MSIRIRPAGEGDVGPAASIERAWGSSPGWGAGQFREELARPNGRFLAAEDDGGLAGFAVVWMLPPEAQLLDIAVRPDLARRGVGRLLLDAVMLAAVEAGCSVLQLEVAEDNDPALRLYGSAGMRVVGRRAKYYNGRTDALLMDVRLPGPPRTG